MPPEFSLIIPTYNRYQALCSCFRRLEKLRWNKHDFEVIVVDDGSSDQTKDMTSSAGDFDLRVIHQTNAGAAAARNCGILAARGTICLFIDDDVMVHPDLLLAHHCAHLAWPNRVVRGPVINIPALPSAGSSQEQLQLGQVPLPGLAAMYHHYSRNYLCTSNASLFRTHLLASGLFDPSFPRWEDAELAVRLKKLGLQLYFTFKGVVFHLKPPESLDSLLKTAAKDGASAAALYLRYPSLRMRLRSGLHFLNSFRNNLFTNKLMSPWLASSLEGRGPWPQAMAQALAVEKAYLVAGFNALNLNRKTTSENCDSKRT